MSDRRQEAINDFGVPSYQYDCGGYGSVEIYWFEHMLMMDTYKSFKRLQVRKKWFNLFGEEALYSCRDDGWKICPPNVQAKWEMHNVDTILLGVSHE